MQRVVSAPAELDVASAGTFASELSGEATVVIDCSRVEFIDSSGLQALLEARQRAIGDGGQVVLRAPTAVVRRLLAITSTDDLFTIEA